jgi:pimeloyl-ACP methyl ester carboxylesterase
VALLDAAGVERAHLVGHDWGGGLAWAMAGSHPDRVATLTALSTPHPAAVRRAAMTTPWQLAHSSYMLFFQLPWLPEQALGRGLERMLLGSGIPRGAHRCAGLVPRAAAGERRAAPLPRPDDVRMGAPRRLPRTAGGRGDRSHGAGRLPLRRGRRGALAPGAAARALRG